MRPKATDEVDAIAWAARAWAYVDSEVQRALHETAGAMRNSPTKMFEALRSSPTRMLHAMRGSPTKMLAPRSNSPLFDFHLGAMNRPRAVRQRY